MIQIRLDIKLPPSSPKHYTLADLEWVVMTAVFATTTAATSISETAAPNAKSGAKGGVILVGNTGADTLTGGDGVDLIATNDNAPFINARAG